MGSAGVVAEDGEGAALLRVRAIPGAKREGIAGVVGGRLKVKVSAPAEAGKANAAICAVIASALGVRARDVSVASGAASAEKTLRIEGVGAQRVTEAFGLSGG